MNDKPHPEIPAGEYCYDRHELCPHWKATATGARCELLGVESEREDPHNLIWIQVKECRINLSWEEDTTGECG